MLVLFIRAQESSRFSLCLAISRLYNIHRHIVGYTLLVQLVIDKHSHFNWLGTNAVLLLIRYTRVYELHHASASLIHSTGVIL